MARQTGIIKLKGTIADISFYESSDGHLARAKGGVENLSFNRSIIHFNTSNSLEFFNISFLNVKIAV